MYSRQEKEKALEIYKQTESVSATVRILGYPTREHLYHWIYESKRPQKERKQLPFVGNPPEHPRNPSLYVKLDAIKRCFEQGENVKFVSEDIGYSRASIYQWRKRYLKEGTLGLMNSKNIAFGELKEGVVSTESYVLSTQEIEELRKQMLDMQMEIDILKETINVLKKRPRHRSDSSQQQRAV